MVFGSFSKERFPDAGFHHQSSRSQIAFQEDTNTAEALINHGGAGAPWRSKVTGAAGPLGCDGLWEGGLEGRGLVLSCPLRCALMRPGSLEALSGPCTAPSASRTQSPGHRGTEGWVHFLVAVPALQEFRRGRGRGERTRLSVDSSVFVLIPSSPLGLSLVTREGRQLFEPKQGSWGPQTPSLSTCSFLGRREGL